ncbi:MAG TPA: acetylglutamate kinase, partial [Anaerovoracaceae bacterium]|nr:acetylglutamate kinase [Anaerovoracaceae bacterium]
LGGMDGGMIQASMRKGEKDWGLVGDITTINPRVVNDILSKGYIPVVSGIAQAVDGDGIYNVNADTVAAELAVALGAIKLILLTDVRGVLGDATDEETLISRIKLQDVHSLKEKGIITGGMLPKVECCVKALQGGVERTHIIDGRIEHSILIELLSDEGIGTMITA